MTVSVTDLTGRPGGPPATLPEAWADAVAWLGESCGAAAAAAGGTVTCDPFEVVTRRARLLGFEANGPVSCGGATRLVAAADGWIALGLARVDDLELLPAWLGETVPLDDPWGAVAAAGARRSTADLLDGGILLGLPISVVGELQWTSGPLVPAERVLAPPTRPAPGSLSGLRVADCSSLWAGPQCARLLQLAGAEVVKVESAHRRDGARSGSRTFYESLHSQQPERSFDFRTAAGREDLRAFLAGADVVIEGSRPRAFDQLGLDRLELLTAGRVRVWVSVTAYGRSGAASHRVGFGDDAAAAGGLVAWDGSGPCFVGDAIADPLTGLAAARATFLALAAGGSWLLDASLARTAAFTARGRGTPPRRR